MFSIKHHPNLKHQVRLVVTSDSGTGKSSLNAAAASERFPESVSPVLPPTRLPADYYPNAVPVTIIDTASSLEGKAKLEEELKRADAVVLTYACDKSETLSRLQTFWIPKVRRLKVKALVIVVGCKLDLHDEHYLSNGPISGTSPERDARRPKTSAVGCRGGGVSGLGDA
ncbi:mitochondrial Rho GTPase 2 [Helianthus annuus]|uniref:mitochondrial Rho GTPase 2 n=1 Tax=Helianthus annuus TaxID=4232 RepID=UPI000B906F36|nr:mitochondrial Rho GTPase 2 [Helianthus annuus]